MVSISASRLDRPLLRGEVVEQDVRGDLPRPDRDAACQVLQVLATCAVGRGPLPERAIVTQEPLNGFDPLRCEQDNYPQWYM